MNCVLDNIAFQSEYTESNSATSKTWSKYLTPSPTPLWHTARKSQYRHISATPQSLCQPSQLWTLSSLKKNPWREICIEPKAEPTDRNRQIDQLPRPQIVFRFYNNNSSWVKAPRQGHLPHCTWKNTHSVLVFIIWVCRSNDGPNATEVVVTTLEQDLLFSSFFFVILSSYIEHFFTREFEPSVIFFICSIKWSMSLSMLARSGFSNRSLREQVVSCSTV